MNNNIEHVVLLMMENRSLDSLLGWLYENEEPEHNIPDVKPGENKYEGLQAVDFKQFVNASKDGSLKSPPVKGASGLTIPSSAPGEEFEHVDVQFFEKENVKEGDLATMKGFLNDFASVLASRGVEKEDIDFLAPKIMESYTPAQLPVLNGLARHYAVSDMWFASVPSQTNPNRAFSLCGTSMGLASNGFLEENPEAALVKEAIGMNVGDDRFRHKTLWNALEEAGEKDWKIFWETSMIPHKISLLIEKIDILSKKGSLGKIAKMETLKSIVDKIKDLASYLEEISSGKVESCYTYRMFPLLEEKIPNVKDRFSKIEEFHKLARAGNLPKFSYLEPHWTISKTSVDRGYEQFFTSLGNDYHAPCNMDTAEEYVQGIYQSLTANKEAWNKTLFVITFDEHVGLFDHVSPPAAAPPWGADADKPDYIRLQDGFKFNRYGARVPTLLISPYIKKGTVFRSTSGVPYDHTSLISTILKWVGAEEKKKEFGVRTTQAPTFENVVTLDTPRNDEKDISFLNLSRKMGTPVKFMDRFYLKDENGKFLTAFDDDVKASIVDWVIDREEIGESILFDLGITAYFPTLNKGKNTILYFQNRDNRSDDGDVSNGKNVKLISTEYGLNAYNVLGAWSDSKDCYYYNDYLQGENDDKQTWIIEKVDSGSSTINFGDKVYLVNKYFTKQRLTKDRYWLTTSKSGGYWTVETVPDTD